MAFEQIFDVEKIRAQHAIGKQGARVLGGAWELRVAPARVPVFVCVCA